MAPGLGPRLRFLLRKFHEEFDHFADGKPNVKAALAGLDEAVAEGFPSEARRASSKGRVGRPGSLVSNVLARLRNQLKWARKRRRMADDQVAKMKRAKDGRKHNRIEPRFLAKVALSSPSSCARAFARSWRDIVGDGTLAVSRTSIGRIRDAFAEVCKGMSSGQVRVAAESACQAAAASESGFVCAAVLHIHDEASLRLRSSLDGRPGLPARSRTSKVQQHSVVVFMSGQTPVRWLVELDTLSDKTAATLAHALERIVRPLADTLASALTRPLDAPRPWFVHWLVGDGASTNEAGAKILLAALRRSSLPGGLRYFMAVVKCSNHQANLAIGSAVHGRCALVGAECARTPGGAECARSPGSASKSVCGAIVRLFKYLVSDYEEEFLANLQELVAQRLSARPTGSAAALDAQRQRSQDLRSLYGASVVPDEILRLLNGGVAQWTHVPEYSALVDQPGYMEGLRDELVLALRKRVLLVDEKPTPTRMFTFAGHMDCLLLLRIMDLTPIIKMRRSAPRERSRKRVDKVCSFMASSDTDQYLRRTCLALQIVAHINALCAQLREGEPLLVRLSKGAAQARVNADFARLLALLHLDASLDIAGAVALLLATSVEVVLRFQQYSAWPCACWRLCREYNREGYLVACMDFLQLPQAELDHGLGVPLQRLALASGAREVEQVRWLCSEPVQAALASGFRASAASSLPVERAFAETKRSEAPRLCHVATAGRNQLLKHFLRQRAALEASATRSMAVLRKASRRNLQSIAWQKRKDLVGQGADMKRFIGENKEVLEEELQRDRSSATAEEDRRKEAPIPVTQEDWASWFETNADEFHELMSSAPRQRRELNKRLGPAPDTPAPVARLLPGQAGRTAASRVGWKRLAWRRTGWYCVSLRPRGAALMYLHEFHGQTYFVDFSHLRDGRAHQLSSDDVSHLLAAIAPLESAEWPGHEVEQFLRAQVSATASPAGVSLQVVGLRPVTEAVKGPRRRKSARGARAPAPGARAPAPGARDSDSEGSSAAGSDDEAEGLSDLGTDAESSCPSVDTQADSGLDDLLPYAAKADDSDAGASDLNDPEKEAAAAKSAGDLGRYRHPAGTWTIWSNTWVYITKTPPSKASPTRDVKCNVRGPLRNDSGGLGKKDLSRTLTPAHYGEAWEDPVRTLLLLRSWAVWRVQQKGWSAAKACRQRELDREKMRLEADFREVLGAGGGAVATPLFGSPKAQKLLSKWVPDLLGRLSE